jgi:phosphate acetyltransferase
MDLTNLHARARALNKRIVLPEGEDSRTIRAVRTLVEEGIARPVLLGRPDRVRALADEEGFALPHTVPIIDPASSEKQTAFAQVLFQRRKHKGLAYEQARHVVTDVLYFGDLMVREGEADGCVAGAAHPSPDVVRAAIQVLGVAEGSALVSSFFLMVLPDGRPLTYADCGVNPDPDSAQLASIGIDAADNHRFLTGEEPSVAFLSFSTKGSAEHPAVDKVTEAVRLAREQRPDLVLDGALQFDAAFVPSVAERKAPDSPVAGQANVFVFPDLNAGNIGYKITQRIGGAEAFGPILQGLTRPANDLSRGCDAEDIVNVVAITAIQADARDRAK